MASMFFLRTSKSDQSLPPPSIKIDLFCGVTIKLQSPCPTSTKYIFKFLGIIKIKLYNKLKINIVEINFFLFDLILYFIKLITFLTLFFYILGSFSKFIFTIKLVKKIKA